MGFDTRFQLIDLNLLAPVMEALVGGTAPPPSAFDRAPNASTLWENTRTYWLGSDPTKAAQALCWLAVSWSSATLPGISLRNVALTHEPIRMPDEYRRIGDLEGIEAPSLLPLLLDEERGACAPASLASGAPTGAFIADPAAAGASLLAFVQSLEPQARYVPAKLLALLRAAERSGLAVWECLECGGTCDTEADPRWTLHWPGLPERYALQAPLSEQEWARVQGSWFTQAGDLEDLLALASWTKPEEQTSRVYARRALQTALEASKPPVPFSYGAAAAAQRRERVLGWLEAARAPQEGPSPEQQKRELAALFRELRPLKPVPAERAEDFAARWHALFLAAPEHATVDAIGDGCVFRDTTALALLLRRFDGPGTPILAALVSRLLDLCRDDDSPDSLLHRTLRERSQWLLTLANIADERTSAELREAYRRSLQTVLARAYLLDRSDSEGYARVVDSWHALYLLDAKSARANLPSPRGCAHLAGILRRLEGPPELELGQLVFELFDAAVMNDEEPREDSPLVEATRARRAWLEQLISALQRSAPELAAKLEPEVGRWSPQ